MANCASGEEALALVKTIGFDVGVLDLAMPGISGIELLKGIKELQPDFEAIMLTGQASVDSAIEAMKLGAYDYLAKPCKLFELEIIIRKAFEKKMLTEQNKSLVSQIKSKESGRKLLGSSAKARNLRELIERAADLDGPVLIQGEAGAGKETAALSTHRLSARKDNPFITVNCGALAEGLLEIELFGHEENAFLGAGLQRKGALENANGGSVFLKAIDQAAASTQVKILGFLETGGFCRVGGSGLVSVNTRLFFGTTQNLLNLTQNGKFRDDLFYKISAITISTPSVRERKEDIPEIAENIIKNNNTSGPGARQLSKKAIDALLKYDWPGNVRELVNVLERAIITSTKNTIQMKDLPVIFEKSPRHRRSADVFFCFPFNHPLSKHNGAVI